MAFTIVRVASGGIPVVESPTGLPYYEADNGFGIPVTFGSTGIPLGGVQQPPPGEQFSTVTDNNGSEQFITVMDTNSAEQRITIATGLS